MKNNLIFVVSIHLFFNYLISYSKSYQLYSNDPDIDLNSSQLIESRGFLSQTHHVITDDGNILTIFRIINPLLRTKPNLYPILLQHGYIQNSDSWLITSHGLLNSDGIYTEDNNLINNCSSADSVGRTLAFVLSVCGYDVWIGNIRGNKYSSHLFLDRKTDMKYWAFTNDHYTYDLSAKIDYILRVTERESLGYIGHSLGTTMMFQLLSTKPEYSAKIKPFIAMAPFCYLTNMTSLVRLVSSYESFLSSKAFPFPMLNIGSIDQMIGRYFCGNSLYTGLCAYIDFLVTGFDYPQLDITQLPRQFAHYPDSTSSFCLAHSAQRINRGNFDFYDYGINKNLIVYGQTKPPVYKLSNISNKYIILMTANNDFLSNQTNNDMLRSQLTVPLYADYIISDNLWNHRDFIFGVSNGKVINHYILKTLKSILNYN